MVYVTVSVTAVAVSASAVLVMLQQSVQLLCPFHTMVSLVLWPVKLCILLAVCTMVSLQRFYMMTTRFGNIFTLR